ncbi:hypothetical protein AKJ52_00945 [candidate division MSBL1 archaeon SCGC-AAA382C18]|uniref:CARDB domain-containing protein n=1 Tax=candidate division MSBL1 archaeon SCGC-AAA382C18 TaxID=1698281 RepID=A0A133VKW8_9EURY|nr:hypothetical protein AKJ52_00945 [candidate division MSBL1 archaeon SCGC-AAA382C18]
MERKLLAVVLAVVIVASFSVGVYSRELLRPGGKAEFMLENLKVTPFSPYGEIYNQTPVTISVDVSNRGDISGVKRVSIRIDNEEVADNALLLVAGESRTFKAEVKAGDEAHRVGTHTVRVGNLTRTYRVEEIPVKVSIGGLVRPRGVLYNCAEGESAQPRSPLLEISATNEGNENMVPFRVVVETPEGAFSEGGVIGQMEDVCARSNLQGETIYYVPISSYPASPRPGEYKLKVADYNIQGVREKKINYSGPSPEVTRWGPVQFERRESGLAASQGKVTVRNEGDLPLSVAGLFISVGGENLRGAVIGAPFVLPQEERILQIEFENHTGVPEGTHTAEFKLLEWVRREGSEGVVVAAETTKEIEIE